MAKYDNFDMNDYEDFKDVLEKAYDKGYNQGLKDEEDNSNDRYDDGYNEGYNEGLDKGRDEERDRPIIDKLKDTMSHWTDGYIAIVLPDFIEKLIINKEHLTPAIIEELTTILVDKKVF